MNPTFAKTLSLALLTPFIVVSCSTTEEKKEILALETADGLARVETYQLSGSVAALDAHARQLMLNLPGERQVIVAAAPGVANFAQIRVNDQLNLLVTEELAVFLSKTELPGSTYAKGVALAPVGEVPGRVIAKIRQVRAMVSAIDVRLRKVVLSMPDGTSKTVKAAKAVDLSDIKLRDFVLVEYTETLALNVDIIRGVP